jgi:hypothetical protein
MTTANSIIGQGSFLSSHRHLLASQHLATKAYRTMDGSLSSSEKESRKIEAASMGKMMKRPQLSHQDLQDWCRIYKFG